MHIWPDLLAAVLAYLATNINQRREMVNLDYHFLAPVIGKVRMTCKNSELVNTQEKPPCQVEYELQGKTRVWLFQVGGK